MEVLYIHGFNGSPSGSTGTFVRKRFGKVNVVAPPLAIGFATLQLPAPQSRESMD